MQQSTHLLVGPAEAAPVPVLCRPKELLEELEDSVGLQPLPVCLVELLETWALHADWQAQSLLTAMQVPIVTVSQRPFWTIPPTSTASTVAFRLI